MRKIAILLLVAVLAGCGNVDPHHIVGSSWETKNRLYGVTFGENGQGRVVYYDWATQKKTQDDPFAYRLSEVGAEQTDAPVKISFRVTGDTMDEDGLSGGPLIRVRALTSPTPAQMPRP